MLHAPRAEAGGEGAGAGAIREGDLVVVYERADSMKAARVQAAGAYGSRFGTFHMKARGPVRKPATAWPGCGGVQLGGVGQTSAALSC